MTPRVSVIVTVYKRTTYLAEALESVLAQSYQNYEIIVADDSGTAAAKEIVAALGHLDRVMYLANPTTLGVALNVVQARKQARGEFVAILNDDDVWEPNLLEELVAPLERDPDRMLATSDHWIMNANGDIDRDLSESWSVNFGRSTLPEGVVPDAAEFVVLKRGAAINLTSVFRNDAVDWSLLVPEVAGAYDYWLSCLLAATRKPIYYIPRRMGRWRIHGRMETCRLSHNKNESLVYIYSTLLERDWFPELRPALRAKLGEALFATGRDKLHFNRVQEARMCFWRCFRLSRNLRALTRAGATFLPGAVRRRLTACVSTLRAGTNYQQETRAQIASGFYSRNFKRDF